MTFALTGLCGVTLYYLLENIALTYSMASNIGVIISIAPFFYGNLITLYFERRDIESKFYNWFYGCNGGDYAY